MPWSLLFKNIGTSFENVDAVVLDPAVKNSCVKARNALEAQHKVLGELDQATNQRMLAWNKLMEALRHSALDAQAQSRASKAAGIVTGGYSALVGAVVRDWKDTLKDVTNATAVFSSPRTLDLKKFREARARVRLTYEEKRKKLSVAYQQELQEKEAEFLRVCTIISARSGQLKGLALTANAIRAELEVIAEGQISAVLAEVGKRDRAIQAILDKTAHLIRQAKQSQRAIEEEIVRIDQAYKIFDQVAQRAAKSENEQEFQKFVAPLQKAWNGFFVQFKQNKISENMAIITQDYQGIKAAYSAPLSAQRKDANSVPEEATDFGELWNQEKARLKYVLRWLIAEQEALKGTGLKLGESSWERNIVLLSQAHDLIDKVSYNIRRAA